MAHLLRTKTPQVAPEFPAPVEQPPNYQAPPEALRTLLQYVDFGDIFADGFESGDTSAWSQTVP